ncbi:hypothetical protein FCL40_08610 [Ferrimonas sediminicola]|uniref:Uncharacterized protein n=1 Tax=Ferrimonas sediminicola TaxID=2569538 RepID=A0A4U1BEC2_9GAMM|nr:hypothetical protein [Ferrimonas sediminicola]TKB49386.1 hypothetical protein FCL40_08610 [Ferrimonas sediminicola]
MSRQLDPLLQELDREISPSRDLWPAIEGRLDRSPLPATPRRPWLPWAMAACLLLTSLGGFLGGRLSRPAPHAPLLGMLELLQQQHQTQRQQLAPWGTGTLQLTSTLPGDQAATEALASIRGAERELFEALQTQPDNRELLQLWLWVQQRELDLINKQQQRHQRLQHL